MCGRFSLHLTDLREVGERFALGQTHIDGWVPRHNIAPSQGAPVVVQRGERRLDVQQWGLIPHWNRDPRGGRRPINARSESAARLPTFRDALRQRRCVVPATGYYEWQVAADGAKQPFWIASSETSLLALAGLWQCWTAPDGLEHNTFALLTTAARGELRAIHDRMPLLVPDSAIDVWLGSGPGEPLLGPLLAQQPPAAQLVARPVSRLVNSPANDGPECLLPPDPAPPVRQLALFGEG